MVKCGACGKYLSMTDRACCHKCTAAYHKVCVALPTLANVKDSWICPGCKIKIPKSDNTPCKLHTADNDPACTPPAEDVTHGSAEEPYSTWRSRFGHYAMNLSLLEMRCGNIDAKCRLPLAHLIPSYWVRAARVRRFLDTKILELPGPPTNIYINERLSRYKCHLFFLARQAAKNKNWRFVWTRKKFLRGRQKGTGQSIFARKKMLKSFSYCI
ncbi:hypothetical protein ACJJTC_000398 [Scirpophaga incertulas]